MTRARAALAFAAAVLLASPLARAEASARLVFIRGESASVCPDETALRRAVEARLGYDPFLPWAGASVVVRLDREAGAFVANVELVTGGASRGARTLRSDDPACLGLVDATALAVTIALDAAETAPPPAPAAPSEPFLPPPPSMAAATAPPDSDAPPPGPRGATGSPARVQPFVGLDATLSAGSAPSISAGFAGWVRARQGPWSAAIEARVDLPSSGASSQEGGVSTWLVAGGLVPCFHLGPAFGCAVGELGFLRGTGVDVSLPKSGYDLFAALGPRLGIEIPLGRTLALRLRADALVDLARAVVTLDTLPAWRASLFTGTLGAGFAVRIP